MADQAVLRMEFPWTKIQLPIHRQRARLCEAPVTFAFLFLVDIGGNTAPVEMMDSQFPDVSFIVSHPRQLQ